MNIAISLASIGKRSLIHQGTLGDQIGRCAADALDPSTMSASPLIAAQKMG